jgi:hypothetical protein
MPFVADWGCESFGVWAEALPKYNPTMTKTAATDNPSVNRVEVFLRGIGCISSLFKIENKLLWW